MITASELRSRARETLGGNIFSAPWLYALVVALIAQVILSVSSFTFVLVLILIGPITMGMQNYFLSRVRKSAPHDNLSLIFDGFTGDIGGNIITGVLITIFTALWTMLFIIPGIVKSYAYSMAYFIKLDHPEYTATQAISESRKLMNGHKMRLFILYLSFLGWLILGALCFGIGTLWVLPYQYTARAEFYKDLVGSKAEIPTLDPIV